MNLFFDTETTGLPKKYNAPVEDLDNWPRIVQIAWMTYDSSGNCLSEEDYIIKPNGFVIPESASNVHGITTEKALAEGSDLETVLCKFSNDVKKVEIIVAHNMGFDEKIVGAELFRTEIDHDLFETQRICTMLSSTNFCKIPGRYGRYKWPNLTELHHFLFDQDFEGAHNALADVKACAKCFFELKKRGAIR